MIVEHIGGNMFYLPVSYDEAVAVTTNGVVKANHEAVMGAGCAKEANELFHVSKKLGKYLLEYGNRPFNLGLYSNGETRLTLLTFPTKWDWKDKSDMRLIKKSATHLIEMADKFQLKKIYIPRVGCGCGGLDWNKEVCPYLKTVFDDRFIAVTRY